MIRGESNSPKFYNFCVRQFMYCNYLFFCLIISSCLSPSFWHPILQQFCKKNRKRKRMRLKNRHFHELPYIENVKSGNIRLALDIKKYWHTWSRVSRGGSRWTLHSGPNMNLIFNIPTTIGLAAMYGILKQITALFCPLGVWNASRFWIQNIPYRFMY